MEWLSQNKEWIVVGIPVVSITIGFAIKFIFKFVFKRTENNQISNTNNNNVVINNNIELNDKNSSAKSERSLDKTSVQILFVDDQKFDIVDSLKKAGWTNTRRIKDVTDLDATDVKNSDIIFVDVNGVGCKLFPKDQGLGLAAAIKNKYPEKYIVLYSAVTHNFHSALNVVDFVLEKNAEPYQFINTLENYINNENTNKRR